MAEVYPNEASLAPSLLNPFSAGRLVSGSYLSSRPNALNMTVPTGGGWASFDPPEFAASIPSRISSQAVSPLGIGDLNIINNWNLLYQTNQMTGEWGSNFADVILQGVQSFFPIQTIMDPGTNQGQTIVYNPWTPAPIRLQTGKTSAARVYRAGNGLTLNASTFQIALENSPGEYPGLEFSDKQLRVKIKPDAGLVRDGDGLSAKVYTAHGLEVDSNGLGVKLHATNPGLEFDDTSGLRAKADSSTGLTIGADGLALAYTAPLYVDYSNQLALSINSTHFVIDDSDALSLDLSAIAGDGLRGDSDALHVDLLDPEDGLLMFDPSHGALIHAGKGTASYTEYEEGTSNSVVMVHGERLQANVKVYYDWGGHVSAVAVTLTNLGV